MTKQASTHHTPMILSPLGFFICSFIGWAYEVILTSAYCGIFVDRGFLTLPICPIYGIFSIIAVLVFRKKSNNLLVFTAGSLLATLFELVCSYLIDAFLHIKLWDYSHWPLNLDGRISLLSSIIFGLLCLIPVKFVEPALTKIRSKLDKYTYIGINIGLLIIMITDTAFCIMKS